MSRSGSVIAQVRTGMTSNCPPTLPSLARNCSMTCLWISRQSMILLSVAEIVVGVVVGFELLERDHGKTQPQR